MTEAKMDFAPDTTPDSKDDDDDDEGGDESVEPEGGTKLVVVRDLMQVMHFAKSFLVLHCLLLKQSLDRSVLQLAQVRVCVAISVGGSGGYHTLNPPGVSVAGGIGYGMELDKYLLDGLLGAQS